MNELFFEDGRPVGEGLRLQPEQAAFELFCEDGHLSDSGLDALIGGRLDELESLEAAEHLGFCGPCMERYAARLTEGTLCAPRNDLALPVARRLRQKTFRVTTRRYAAAAAAVALTLSLWGAGVFEQMTPPRVELTAPGPVARTETLGSRISSALNGMLWAAGDLCGGLLSPRMPEPPQAQPDAPEQTAKPAQEDREQPPAPAQASDANGQDRPDAATREKTGWHGRRNGSEGEDRPSTTQAPARTPASAMRGEE